MAAVADTAMARFPKFLLTNSEIRIIAFSRKARVPVNTQNAYRAAMTQRRHILDSLPGLHTLDLAIRTDLYGLVPFGPAQLKHLYRIFGKPVCVAMTQQEQNQQREMRGTLLIRVVRYLQTLTTGGIASLTDTCFRSGNFSVATLWQVYLKRFSGLCRLIAIHV